RELAVARPLRPELALVEHDPPMRRLRRRDARRQPRELRPELARTPRRAHAAERPVRRERALLGGEAEPGQAGLDLMRDLGEPHAVAARAGPEHAGRAALRERAEPVQRQPRRGAADRTAQRLLDAGGLLARNVAEEAQRQVQALAAREAHVGA